MFTMNATHGLNIAIRSLVVPGSRVVISGYEHNAVCRPLYAIPEVRLKVVDAFLKSDNKPSDISTPLVSISGWLQARSLIRRLKSAPLSASWTRR